MYRFEISFVERSIPGLRQSCILEQRASSFEFPEVFVFLDWCAGLRPPRLKSPNHFHFHGSQSYRRSLLQGAPLAGLLSVAFKLMVDSVDFPIFTCPFCSLEVDSDSSFCKLHRAMAGILHSWLGIKFFHAGFLFFMMPQIESSLECSWHCRIPIWSKADPSAVLIRIACTRIS